MRRGSRRPARSGRAEGRAARGGEGELGERTDGDLLCLDRVGCDDSAARGRGREGAQRRRGGACRSREREETEVSGWSGERGRTCCAREQRHWHGWQQWLGVEGERGEEGGGEGRRREATAPRRSRLGPIARRRVGDTAPQRDPCGSLRQSARSRTSQLLLATQLHCSEASAQLHLCSALLTCSLRNPLCYRRSFSSPSRTVPRHCLAIASPRHGPFTPVLASGSPSTLPKAYGLARRGPLPLTGATPLDPAAPGPLVFCCRAHARNLGERPCLAVCSDKAYPRNEGKARLAARPCLAAQSAAPLDAAPVPFPQLSSHRLHSERPHAPLARLALKHKQVAHGLLLAADGVEDVLPEEAAEDGARGGELGALEGREAAVGARARV